MTRHLAAALALLLTLLRSAGAVAAPPGASAVEPARAELLADHLERASSLAAIEPYLPAIGGTLCTAGAVGLALADERELPSSPVVRAAPAAGCAVASFGSYLLPRDYQGSVDTFALLTAASSPIAIAAVTSSDATTAERVTLLGLAGSTMSVGTLRLIDALVERPVSWTALATDARALRARGRELTRAEVQRMEADYRRATVRPVPRWGYGLALLAGGLVSLSPVAVRSTSHDDRTLAAFLGGVMVVNATIDLGLALSMPDGYDRYVSGLSGLGLTPLGPSGAAGLWASGAF